jgi:hypothetical protein
VTNINYPDKTIGDQTYFYLSDSGGHTSPIDVNSLNNGMLKEHSQPGDKTSGVLVFNIGKPDTPTTLNYNDLVNNLNVTL